MKLKYPVVLFWLFACIWAVLAVNPSYRFDWMLENLLVLPFVIFIVWSYKKFRFSNISYTCIFLFMILHTFGSHYTYSQVPFGYWLQELFNSTRNQYDRLVHFGFGLLLAYPVREIFLRIAATHGVWGYYLPIELTFAMSAIYEIIEWAVAVIVNPNAGNSFLGTQGDIWDAQKDMAMAGAGTLASMGITMLINSKIKNNFRHDIIKSLKVKRKMPLGEKAIKRMMKK
jgi:putative membrane protein